MLAHLDDGVGHVLERLRTEGIADRALVVLHLTGANDAAIRDHHYWRMGGRAALREGNWKIHRPAANRPWELDELMADPGEAHDLSGTESARRQALIATFQRMDAEMMKPLWGPAGRR